MILIPEIETVVILVPRTGSGSLRRAIAATYPHSMQIYRHMEADGAPMGYDRWRRLGVVRHPLDRLWSLYKFCRNPLDYGSMWHSRADALKRSTDRPFSDWIVNNETVFATPIDADGRYWPGYAARHPMPETRKSQFHYLRPDLGTQIFRFDQLDHVERRLGVALDLYNVTDPAPMPALSAEAHVHMANVFAWDYGAAGRLPVEAAGFKAAAA